MNESDDVLGPLIVDRDASELVFRHDAGDRLEVGIDGKRDDLRPRSHDLARGVIGKIDQVLNGVLLKLFEEAFVPARLDDVFQLFRRMSAVSVFCSKAEYAKGQCRG